MSIGNDIVAIKSSKPERIKLYSFYSKILSEEEQQLYKNYEVGMPFEIFVWLLWSVKEAVYKCLKRTDAELIFAPVKINVGRIICPGQLISMGDNEHNIGFKQDMFYIATINYQDLICYSRSSITDEYIHSVVTYKADGDNVYWGTRYIDDVHHQNQSAQVRTFALERLSVLLPSRGLTVEKSPSDYPYFTQHGIELPVPLSFSHHGHYVAYAFTLP